LLHLATSAIPTVSDWQLVLRLALAALLGGAIGVERELRDREAGIRTHLLVSLGSALFTIISAFGFHEFLSSGASVVRADPTRIAAQIVTGIGFLGAGAIIREGLSVRGLTTAATLWVVAAIGMACGAGWYGAALVTTFFTIVALGPLRSAAYNWMTRFKPEENHLVVELKEGQPVGPFIAQLGDIRHFELTEESDRRVLRLELPRVDEELVSRLSDLDYVIGVRWRR
jgi:putative Mg2+ transporter-C (MgtC) family protein